MSADAQFTDGKDPEALRTIGEVAKALGIRQHVLRYWEEQFPMLSPLKRSGGRRYYRPSDLRLVETIHRLVHQQGYTLKGAKNALSGAGERDGNLGQPGAAAVPPAVAASAGSNNAAFALRARLIGLRTNLVNALHEA